MVERPTLPPLPPNLTRLYVISGVLWVICLGLSVWIGDSPWAGLAVVQAVLDACAGAAFGVLIAAFIFDRFRRSAEERSRREHTKQSQLFDQALHDLWVDEFADPYETQIDVVMIHLVELSRRLLRLCRLGPVRRALEERKCGTHWIPSELLPLTTQVSVMASAPISPTATLRVLSQSAELVEHTKRQLELFPFPLTDRKDTANLDLPDPRLLEAFSRDCSRDLPQVQETVDRIWTLLQSLAALHKDFQKDRLAEPDISIGPPMRTGTQLLAWVAEWRLRDDDQSETMDELLVTAQHHAWKATGLAKDAVGLCEDLIQLRSNMHALAYRSMDFQAGKDFIKATEANTEATIAHLVAATTVSDGYSDVPSTVTNTFSAVAEDDLVPAYLRDRP